MVSKIQFTSSGLVIPAESTILAEVQADINAAFGGTLNPALKTPQGQLASSETAIIGDNNNNIAQLVNDIDPRYSSGLVQDAIGSLFRIYRYPASSTVVNCNCVGAIGTFIPQGSRAVSVDGNIYESTQGATIPIGGTISVPFSCLKTGPITCPAGTLKTIYRLIPGWDSITNPADGILGRDVETPQEFEQRRQLVLFVNSQGSIQALRGAILTLPGVMDAFCYSNDTGSAVNVGATSYSVEAWGVYIAVVGGYAADIGDAIMRKKNAGTPTVGNTAVTVYDKTYSPPYPAYTYNFETPSSLSINFLVTIVNDPNLPSNIVTLIQAAIQSAFIGGFTGMPRERIGGTVYASKYYAPAIMAYPQVSILEIKIGKTTADQDTVEAGIDEVPVPGTITVTLV